MTWKQLQGYVEASEGEGGTKWRLSQKKKQRKEKTEEEGEA